VFGLPVSRPHIYEASGLGAAIDAAVGLGMYPDFESAVSQMTRTGDTFEPDVKVHALYDELYHEVYLNMYSRLQPLYNQIRKIVRQHPLSKQDYG